MLMLFSTAFASDNPPSYLKDGKGVITLKNGNKFKFSSNEYAVVKRSNMKKDIGNDAEKRFAKRIIRALKERRIVPNKMNRVYLLGGYGATGGLDQNDNIVNPDEGFVGGIGYQRKLNQDINVGIQVQSNNTTSFSVGYDF